MPKYCKQKFENTQTGEERIYYWRQDKHVHDATIQTDIAKWLGPEWSPRTNSYQSGLSSPPVNGIEYS